MTGLFPFSAVIYNDRNYRALATLHPAAGHKFMDFYRQADADGFEFLIYSAFRSAEEQDRKWRQGRKTPGAIVTNAQGGWSFHNFGCALDLVPADMFGALKWNDYKEFKKIAELARLFEIEQPMPAGDAGHLQWSAGLGIKALRAGVEPVYDEKPPKLYKTPQTIMKELKRAIKRLTGSAKFLRQHELERLEKKYKE
jgi:hypothetical protein